jgi:hypothetical protein
MRSLGDLHEAIIHGAVKRLRPKMMTVTATMLGLMPIMWSIGTGADVMKRIAAPSQADAGAKTAPLTSSGTGLGRLSWQGRRRLVDTSRHTPISLRAPA